MERNINAVNVGLNGVRNGIRDQDSLFHQKIKVIHIFSFILY